MITGGWRNILVSAGLLDRIKAHFLDSKWFENSVTREMGALYNCYVESAGSDDHEAMLGSITITLDLE